MLSILLSQEIESSNTEGYGEWLMGNSTGIKLDEKGEYNIRCEVSELSKFLDQFQKKNNTHLFFPFEFRWKRFQSVVMVSPVNIKWNISFTKLLT